MARLIVNPHVLRCFLRPSLTEAPSLRRSYPASSVVRTSPPPIRPGLALASCPLIPTAITAGASRVAPDPLCLHAVEREYQEQLDDVNAKHRQSRKAVEETRATAESKREELKQLEDDLEKLRADRQLADFIRQRKDSTDYKKHLGVIAQAYADFEQLSILLTKVRQELEGVRTEQSGAGSSVPNDGKKKLLPRIDRIVLYIVSSLCHPASVVQ